MVEEVVVATSDVSARVVAESGVELSGVTVAVFKNAIAQNISVSTDANGRFALALEENTEFTLVFTKDGYANQIVHVKAPEAGHSVGYDVIMIPRGIAQVLANEEMVTVSGNDGASVTLNPSFEDDQGNPVTAGDGVTLTVTPVDVTSPSGLAIFPGNFEGLAENEEEATPIISYGTVEYYFTRNSDGAELQLAPGNTAEIEIPIYTNKHPDGTDIALGDTISLWSLNETTGVWLQEGTGIVVASSSPSGFALKATVSHFTWWNADVSMDAQAEVDITVNAPATGTALIKTRTDANIPWGFNQSDTVVTVGDSTGSLAIPSGVEVCFWAEVSFSSNGSVMSTEESCITASAGTANDMTLEVIDNTPLNISATSTNISRVVNSSIGQIKIQATTFESSVNYNIDSGSLPNGVSLQSIDGTTAVISGVPNELGSFTVLVRGVNADTEESTVSITINVIDEGIALTRDALIQLVKNWANNPSQENADAIINADISQITDLSSMFNINPETFEPIYSGLSEEAKENLRGFNLDISGWDVSHVTDMHFMFEYTAFNQPIENWDVSNVENMFSMFEGATAFNRPIGDWNVSSVTNMNSMFRGVATFNQPIGNWNVSSVTDMWGMFFNASIFNQPIGNWDVSNVEDMKYMFRGTIEFDQALSEWNIANVTDISYMFAYSEAFNQNISGWNTANVTQSENFATGSILQDDFNPFYDPNAALTRYQLENIIYSWSQDPSQENANKIINANVSEITDMSMLFHFHAYEDSMNIRYFNLDISAWDVSSVIYMNEMFSEAIMFNQDISAWDVSSVTDMTDMFYDANTFDQPLGDWNISNVMDVTGMLENTYLSIVNYDNLLQGWSTKTLQQGLDLSIESQYSQDSQDARDILTDTYNWNISDNGVLGNGGGEYIPELSEEDRLAYIIAINNARAEARTCGEHGNFSAVDPVTWNETLYYASYEHSQDMANNFNLVHEGSATSTDWTALQWYNPDLPSSENNMPQPSFPNDRVNYHGYNYVTMSENIAHGISMTTPEQAIDAWLASPDHCKNIMDVNVTEVGMAYEVTNGYYWTQVFADEQ